jgi:hypothetical protein
MMIAVSIQQILICASKNNILLAYILNIIDNDKMHTFANIKISAATCIDLILHANSDKLDLFLSYYNKKKCY